VMTPWLPIPGWSTIPSNLFSCHGTIMLRGHLRPLVKRSYFGACHSCPLACFIPMTCLPVMVGIWVTASFLRFI
jgi:hypothetical protein